MEALYATAAVAGVFYVFCRGVDWLFSPPLDRLYRRRFGKSARR